MLYLVRESVQQLMRGPTMKPRAVVAVLAVALLAFAVSGCASGGTPTVVGVPATTSGDDLTEDYAVYSAMIQKMFIDDLGWSLVVIQDFTGVTDPNSNSILGQSLAAIKYQWPELGDDILSDFTAKNQTSLPLECKFNISVDYTLVSGEEAAAGWPGGTGTQWDEFSEKYPGSLGSVRLSRIGFNQAKDTAVFYLDNTNDGHVVLLRKTAGRWTVQAEAMLWTA
jgi:hypothetical protein